MNGIQQQRLSIGMNGSMLDDQPTGVGVYSFNIINSLSNLYSKENSVPLTVFSPTHSYLNKNIRLIKLSAFLQASRFGKLAAVCRFMWNTFYYPIQARRFSILLSPTTHGSFFLRNQVITIHDLLSLRYRNISAHQRFYFKHLLPFMISRARVVVTVSEATKMDVIHYLKCPPEKIQVVYNGYDETRFFKTEHCEKIILSKYGVSDYLLAVGPTYPHKNFESLFKAYHQLGESIKTRCPLVIVGGKPPYLSKCKQVVKDLDLQDHVHFLGYIPMDLMAALYREALALVFPSLHEGFGFPLLEAMACGCPVVSSNTSSMIEVCADAALYFNPLDIDSMVAAIEQVISNTPLRDTLTEKGLTRCKAFSWTQTARKLKTLIDNQLNSLKYDGDDLLDCIIS